MLFWIIYKIFLIGFFIALPILVAMGISRIGWDWSWGDTVAVVVLSIIGLFGVCFVSSMPIN